MTTDHASIVDTSGEAHRRTPDETPTTMEVLDIAGHELRIPITALKGQVQLLQRRMRRQPGREADAADLDKIAYQIERLNLQLQTFLDVVHLDERRFDMHLRPTNLTEVIRQATLQFAVGSTSHTVRFEAPDEPIVGNFDQMRMRELVSLLVTNAIKYSAEGEVLVRLWVEDDTAHLEVHDRGMGVPAADRARIFRRYQHASNAKNAGVGLGLYIARAIIRRCHGHIGVRALPGEGSIFWCTFPAAGLPLTDDAADDMGDDADD